MRVLKWILIILFWPIALVYYIGKAYLKYARKYQEKLKQNQSIPVHGNTKNKNLQSKEIISNSINEFVVIDFETTGLSPVTNKIIEIGAVKVLSGEIASQYTTLVDPKVKISQEITNINGITNEMVTGKPDIDAAINQLIDFIGELPIVAHNASFDMGFLIANTDREINNTVFDTLKLCRENFEFKSNRLESACAELGIKEDGYHRALTDCICTAKLFLECQKRFNIYPCEIKKTNKKRRVSVKEIVSKQSKVDQNHQFYGKSIVFTGELENYTRKEAMQKTVDLGAVLKSGVSSKVDYLIVGTQNESIVGEDGLSTKERKAYELQEKGHHIEILDEDEFESMI